MRNVLMNVANPIFNSFNMQEGYIMAGGHNTMPFLITGIFYGLMAITYYLYFWKIERGNDQ